MRYAAYARKLRERKERYAYERPSKRRAWRPADYEPDFDGPQSHNRWRTAK